MRKKLLLSIRVLALTMVFVSTLRAADSAESAWTDFRNQFAYHVQTIALFDHHYLIISEPPPHVTVQRLISLAPSILAEPRVFDHPMGVDGWTKDIVFELPQLDNRGLTDLIDTIQLYVFGTTY